MVKVLVRSYDTYFNDYRSYKHIGEYVSEDAAIEAAKAILYCLYQPSDCIELQLHIKTIGINEWQMFGAVHYVGTDNWADTDIMFDEFYC